MSVIFGASFDSVVCLDIDDMPLRSLRDGMIERRAREIGDRFHLGDCLIVLSGLHENRLNYHLIYDQKTRWERIWHIIRRLAREGILEDKLNSLRLSRGDFTTRMNRKTADGFDPFPVGFVECDYPILGDLVPGGIVDWLVHYRISRNMRNRAP